MASSDLDHCNPVRLGLVLNYAIYLREMEREKFKAILAI